MRIRRNSFFKLNSNFVWNPWIVLDSICRRPASFPLSISDAFNIISFNFESFDNVFSKSKSLFMAGTPHMAYRIIKLNKLNIFLLG